jgi:ABC-type uncharacterized transport system permease subunit
MIATAHLLAILLDVGAAVLAAAPFVRPVSAPVRAVVWALALGVAAHVVALVTMGRLNHQLPLTGLGPSLSFAGLVLAITLLAAEAVAREVSLTLVAAPLAAIATAIAAVIGARPMAEPGGLAGAWLYAHIALSFVGIASFGTAAAAGTMYLVERRELKSRRFGPIFRFFPPLATLDRVNHVAAVAGWLVLTFGVILAITYSVAYRSADTLKIVWAAGAWLGVTAVALGRMLGVWQAHRAAWVSSLCFAAVVALYVAFRVAGPSGAQFL